MILFPSLRQVSRARDELRRRRALRSRVRSAVKAVSGDEPLVTVGVTAHNEGERITRCLESILEQSLGAGHIEVIVVDDGSSDGTADTAEAFADSAGWAGFEVHRQGNTGTPSRGRNLIMERARGEFVFLADGDDYLGPQALEAMTREAAVRDAQVVTGHYVGVNRPAPNIRDAQGTRVHEYHSGWLNSLHVQKLFRTEFLRSLPYRFNEQLIYCNDHPFMVAAFLYAQRTSRVDDVDCYFITLEADDPSEVQRRVSRGNISRAEITAVQQLRFLHDVFGLLALARGGAGDVGKLAGRMRVHYWNRFLKNQLPALILRKQDPSLALELAQHARYMTVLYGVQASTSGLTEEARLMLSALQSDEAQEIQAAALQVREQARAKADGASA
ncbi:glycosyltransferase family A protein [Nesterenkonia sp. NBAIMH1]|uniref:glycosyltransferase family 2 protein n=1 Tax=Nesterenkonia sp. NBAIMH1 TaxID=2600320 RepID=UPI00143E04DE|nr:glycosyltransferase family A protein [Nesterenkonia sp. NBAIMH1]